MPETKGKRKKKKRNKKVNLFCFWRNDICMGGIQISSNSTENMHHSWHLAKQPTKNHESPSSWVPELMNMVHLLQAVLVSTAKSKIFLPSPSHNCNNFLHQLLKWKKDSCCKPVSEMPIYIFFFPFLFLDTASVEEGRGRTEICSGWGS